MKKAVIATLVLGILSGTARAQGLPSEGRAAAQAVGLFSQTCLPFAGAPDRVRTWAAERHLPVVPPGQKLLFLGLFPGQVFGASTRDGKMALVSQDDGACRVVMEFGNKDIVGAMLNDRFRALDLAVSVVADKTSPDRQSYQKEWKVTAGPRSWRISITAHVRRQAPTELPEIILIATPGNWS